MIEVYRFNTEDLEKYSLNYLEKLFPVRFKKAFNFKNKKDIDTCLGVGILLHEILKIRECDIKYTNKGKPYCSYLKFSITHTENIVYVITSEKNDVGIDIEKVDRKFTNLFNVFNENEIRCIEDKKFTQMMLWTRKEALLKFLGIGLCANLKKYDVSNNFLKFNNQVISIISRQIDDFILSVAVDLNEEIGQSFKTIFVEI